MAAGGPHQNGDLAHLDSAEPMPEHDANGPKSTLGGSFKVGEDRPGEGQVALVLQFRDPSRGRPVGADPAGEDHHSP